MAKKSKNAPKKSGFLSNLAKSGKSVLFDTATDMMPNLSSAIKKNARFTKTTYTAIKDKYKESDIKESYLYKSGDSLIKNALADIKSGNINNKERAKKNTDDPFEKLLNFDLDSDDDIENAFIDEEGDSKKESLSPNINSMNLNLDEDTRNDLTTIANFSKTSTHISNRGFALMSSQLRNISKFQIQNTVKFYQMVEEKLNSLENHLNISSAYYKDVAENNRKSNRGSADKRSLEAAFSMTGFNIEDWIDIYKENLNDMKGVGSLVGGMMLKPMITNFVNNPIGTLAKMGLKSLIPKGIKNSLGDMDKTFGMLPILLQSKIPKLKEKGGVGGFLAELLDLNKKRVKSDKNAFVKGPISFDGVTKRAITHVIPGYLKRILFAITGNERDRISYDMDKGRFVSDRDAKEHYRNRMDKSRRFNIDDNIEILENEYVKNLKSKKIIKKDEDAAKYIEELRDKLSGLSKNGKTLASDLKLSDLSNDKKTAKILKDIIENQLSVKGRNQVNKAMAESYMSYQQELRNSTSEELWSSIFDQGTYSKKDYEKSKVNTDRFNAFEERMGKFNKKKDEILKDKLYGKIKNEKARGFIDKLFSTNDSGKNSYLEDLMEEKFYSRFKGSEIVDDGYLDRSSKRKRVRNLRKGQVNKEKDSIINELKKNNTLNTLNVLGIDPSSSIAKRILKGLTGKNSDPSHINSTLTTLVMNGKAVGTGLNRGLYQYSTITNEGLALRVKVVGGTVETTEGVSNPSNIDKNEKAKDKVYKMRRKEARKEEKVENKKEGNNISGLLPGPSGMKLLPGGNTSLANRDPNGLIAGYTDYGEPIYIDNNQPKGFKDKAFSMFGKIFSDLTGKDFNAKGIKSLFGDKFQGFLDNHKYGNLLFGYGSALGKTFLASKIGQQLLNKEGTFGTLFGGASNLGRAIFDRASGLFSKGKKRGSKIFTGFTSKTGIDGSFLKDSLFSGLNYAGNKAGNLMNGLGDFISGKKGFKESAGDLFKGTKGTIKDIFKSTGSIGKRLGGLFKRNKSGGKESFFSKAFGKLKNKAKGIFGKKGGKNNHSGLLGSGNAITPAIKNVMGGKPMDTSHIVRTPDGTEVIINDRQNSSFQNEIVNAVDVAFEPVGNSLNNVSLTVSNSLDNLTEVVHESMKDVTETMEQSTALIVANNSSEQGGLGSGLLGTLKNKGKGLLGKAGGFLSKKGGFLGKIGGLLGRFAGGGAATAAAGAGAAGATGGLLGGLGSTVLGLGGSLLGGLGTAGSAALGVGGSLLSGIGSLALPALSALAPFALPIAGIAAAGFGIKKLFDWRKKRKAQKEQEKAMKEASEAQLEFGSKHYSSLSESTDSLSDEELDGKKIKTDAHGKPILGADGKPLTEEKGGIKGFFGKIFGNSSTKQKILDERARLDNPNREGLNQLNSTTSSTETPTGEATVKNNTLLAGPSPNTGEQAQSQASLFYNMIKKDKAKEQDKGAKSDDPMTRMAAYLKPIGEFANSGTARTIFGPMGLFGSMYKGLKQAAGGSLSKLSKFFKDFWNKTSGKGDSGNGSASGGSGINGGTASSATDYLGIYSNSYEGSVGTISSGVGDYGGKSYGIPQFPLNQGTPGKFVDWMSKKYPQYGKYFAGTTQGTAAFDAAWKKLAQDDPDGFTRVQVEYAVDQDVKPFFDQKPGGIDWNRSRVLQEVAYSRAVHMGPGLAAKAVKNAGIKSTDSDEEIVRKFYDECSRNVKSYWKSSPGSWNGLLNRFEKEKKDMLALAAKKAPPIDWASGPGGGSGSASASPQIQKVLSTANAMINAGYPYRLESGAVSPEYGAFDCSGLVQYSYKQAGISLPRLTYDQVKCGTAVPIAGQYGLQNARPGDLLFARRSSRGPEHVMIYEGNNTVLEAANPRTGLVRRSVTYTDFPKKGCDIRRIIGGGLNQGSSDQDLVYGAGNISANNDFRTTKELMKEYRKYDNVPGIKAKRGAVIPEKNLKTPKGGLVQGASVKRNDTLRDNERNSMLLKIKDTLNQIANNTGETNKILTKILDSLINSFNKQYSSDEPLVMSPEITALFKGI